MKLHAVTNHGMSIGKYSISLLLFAGLFFGNVFTVAKAILALVGAVSLNGRRIGKLVDRNAVLWLLFIGAYSINSYVTGFGIESVNLQFLVLPVAAIFAGRAVGLRCKSDKQYLSILFLVAVSLSFFTLLSIFLSIYEQGFAGLSRNIKIVGLGDTEASATILGGYLVILVSLAGALFCPNDDVSALKRILLFCAVGISVVAALRLGSRTHLILPLLSMLIGSTLNRGREGRMRNAVFVVLLAMLPFAVNEVVQSDSMIASYFMDRLNDDTYSAATAGGRIERWSNATVLMLQNPQGWSLALNGYSHNFWLDAARSGGWLAFVLLCLHTLSGIHTCKKAIERNCSCPVFVTSTACVVTGFLLLFALEPILDGFTYIISAYCGFLSLVASATVRRSSIKLAHRVMAR
ncbi:O-antigen ligase family protein [Aromatoleum anaerobium]|uniref:Uncharacterized protein n=2 Tax=Aromatoleum TaxID=551759 RepID=A0ABX1PLW8_9RHOO|nr:hypothetical protein [Aromatoleum anaerobium]MCK0505742.1 hypothetical protein [Aromatoleum anaerobium]